MANFKGALQSSIPMIPRAERLRMSRAVRRYKEVSSAIIKFDQVFDSWDAQVKSNYKQAMAVGTMDARNEFCNFFLASEREVKDHAFKVAHDLQPGLEEKEMLLKGLQVSAPGKVSRTIFSGILDDLSSILGKVKKRLDFVEAAIGASSLLAVYAAASGLWPLATAGAIVAGCLGYCCFKLADARNRIEKYLAEHTGNSKSFDKTIGLIKKAMTTKPGGLFAYVSIMNQEALRDYLFEGTGITVPLARAYASSKGDSDEIHDTARIIDFVRLEKSGTESD